MEYGEGAPYSMYSWTVSLISGLLRRERNMNNSYEEIGVFLQYEEHVRNIRKDVHSNIDIVFV